MGIVNPIPIPMTSCSLTASRTRDPTSVTLQSAQWARLPLASDDTEQFCGVRFASFRQPFFPLEKSVIGISPPTNFVPDEMYYSQKQMGGCISSPKEAIGNIRIELLVKKF